MTDRHPEPVAHVELMEQCRLRSLQLLHENLTSEGILAASRTDEARERGYCAIFGRDASICAIGMGISGDPVLAKGALDGLETLAAHQATSGQIPNIVDVRKAKPDFWYVGCIDATLWWLIAVAILDRHRSQGTLQRHFSAPARRALHWLHCQEHPTFGLLQQNEASDWADIMPRTGFVLYTNALWHLVKRLYGLDGAHVTRDNAARLLMPFTHGPSNDRRSDILASYAREGAQDRGMYLSYVNLASFGDEGDAFGNALAVLGGLAEGPAETRVLGSLDTNGVGDVYPMRVVCSPIAARSRAWRPYMNRHRQNFAWQYHNGGIWPFAGALWITALSEAGRQEAAHIRLAALAGANSLADWGFYEWLHGKTFRPAGMRGQSWNAATYLIAHRAVHTPQPLFRIPAES
jgi:hypothetical protein